LLNPNIDRAVDLTNLLGQVVRDFLIGRQISA